MRTADGLWQPASDTVRILIEVTDMRTAVGEAFGGVLAGGQVHTTM